MGRSSLGEEGENTFAPLGVCLCHSGLLYIFFVAGQWISRKERTSNGEKTEILLYR